MTIALRLLGALVFGVAAALGLPAAGYAQNFGVSTAKVCQLLGDADWSTGQPTNARTATNYGLIGADLGFPIDTGTTGGLYLLFGDADPSNFPSSVPTGPPNDVIGYTSQTGEPAADGCLSLHLESPKAGQFLSPKVQPPIQQGLFNVPSGGAYVGSTAYAFFWTDHCLAPSPLAPDVVNPLHPPTPSATCAEAPNYSSIGRSVIAESTAIEKGQFTWTPPSGSDAGVFRNMPSGFVYASAAADVTSKTVTVTVSSSQQVTGYPVFGVPRYRASIPYLAIAPTASFGDPTSWVFFSGTAESPVWLTRQGWEASTNANGEWIPPASNVEIFAAQPAAERCVGEHSVTYNAPLGQWLMVYACGPWTVEARLASQPWGPWSQPMVLYDAAQTPGVVCTLLQNAGNNCQGRQPDLNKKLSGFFYAPFVLNRYTQSSQLRDPLLNSTTIYWLLSTWNPYTVVVMQTILKPELPRLQ